MTTSEKTSPRLHLGAALVALAAALLLAAVFAPHAMALNCGGLDQPTCKEAPPPGVELELSPSENPHGLQPLSQPPASDRPLWPRVRGHKPYGFNAVSAGTGTTTLSDEVYLHQQVGGSMARVMADWAMIQYYPNWGAGGRPWDYATYLDAKYRAYVRAGIRPILTVIRTPRRFTSRASTRRNSDVPGCGTSDACWNPPRTDADERLEMFAKDLALRYPLAAGIEVWNEPNISNPFWGTEDPDPERYAQMLRIVHDATKAVRPNLPVLGGALANLREDSQDAKGYRYVALGNYARRMLEAGAAAHMDAISYHAQLGPYPHWTSDPKQQHNALSWAMVLPHIYVRDAYAHAGVQMDDRVVITEFGVSTTDGYTREQQEYWLLWQFYAWDVDHPNLALSERTDAAFAHEAVDRAGLPASLHWQEGFGFVEMKDGTGRFATKPVYCTFRTVFGGFDSCPKRLTPR